MLERHEKNVSFADLASFVISWIQFQTNHLPVEQDHLPTQKESHLYPSLQEWFAAAEMGQSSGIAKRPDLHLQGS
jgi:hypothetical protein